MVNLAYLSIMRRYQMENLRQYDDDERPQIHQLVGYRSRFPQEINYHDHKGVDYFLPLGEWLRDSNIRRRKEIVANKKRNQQNNRRPGRSPF